MNNPADRTRREIHVGRLLPIIIVMMIFIAGCRGKSGSDRAGEGKIVVAVSTPALGRLVEEIGGDYFKAVVLIPSGADPENYEPDMATMKTASEAEAMLSLNTIGFEQTLTSRLHSAIPGMQVMDLSAGIEMLEHSHGGGESNHGHEHGEGDRHVHADPHLLSSPRNARKVAANMAQVLIRMCPDAAEGIGERAANLDSVLGDIDSRLLRMFKEKQGTAFVVMHPTMSYFARDYGMRQIALEQDGKEPSPRQMAERIEDARRSAAELMIIDPSKNSRTADHIGRRLGLKPYKADFNAADFINQYLPLGRKLAEDSPSAIEK